MATDLPDLELSPAAILELIELTCIDLQTSNLNDLDRQRVATIRGYVTELELALDETP